MGNQLVCRGGVGAWRPYDPLGDDQLIGRRRKIQSRLPTAKQLEIDSSEQSTIDFGAMLDADGQIDAEPATECIEAGRRTGKPNACQPQRIDKAAVDPRSLKADEFGVEESEVEFGIVNHQPIRTDEGQQFVDDCTKGRLAREKFCGNAVYGERILGHAAPGIDVSVELLAGWDVVHKLYTGDLDDAVTFGRIKTRRFGIKHDLAHHRLTRR